MPHSGICKDLQSVSRMVAGFAPLFLPKLVRDPLLLFWQKKLRFRRTARQQEPGEKTATDRRHSFQNEQPTPTADPKPMHMIKNGAGERCAHDSGDRQT